MARTLFILLLAVVLVQGRFLSDDDGEVVSDGVHDHYHAHAHAANQSVDQSSFLALGGPRLSSSSSSTCDHAYGFFPCAENIPGYLFQIVIFQYLMSVAEQLVSSSSKKIFDTLGTGIFGATVFRILMVFPRIIMTISSGIFNSQEGAQNQVFFGIRVNAGATIFNLTVLWGLCVIVGRRDRATQEKDSQSQPSTQSFASNWLKTLNECGISTDASTSFTAGLMLLSLVPFVLVELVNVVSSASGQRIVVLVALIITVAFLLAYFGYQIIDPTIQKRSLHYSRFENLLTQNGKPNVSRIRLFFHLYDSDNNQQMSSRELEKFLRLIVTDEVQRMVAVKTMMKDLDRDGNSRITEQEFLNGIENLLANNSSADNAAAATPTSTPENDDQEKSGEETNGAAGEVEQAGGEKMGTWDFIVTVLQVILGVAILTFCAQPLMTNVIQFSGAVGVPTFIISFVVLPIVINGRMAIAAIFPASQKSSKAASLTFSEIYNGVTMSNLTGLLSLLAVVYARELTWDYSAEVLVVFVISLTIGFLAYFKTTYQLWTSIFAFFLYPFSLALFYVLQLLGWN
ncbi:PREDICTED: uncharacterized protein LOC109159162 [Ipomoea nil]|uniref:uncharacterized protein LOC109159162 n=1 Tax=Ipomoea nil TaxID=35883 RepID=UPI0009014CCF|nr:PREDICTED: uncharacterized protein LOC109159162 [Ipomoea nil]